MGEARYSHQWERNDQKCRQRFLKDDSQHAVYPCRPWVADAEGKSERLSLANCYKGRSGIKCRDAGSGSKVMRAEYGTPPASRAEAPGRAPRQSAKPEGLSNVIRCANRHLAFPSPVSALARISLQ